MEGNLLIPTTVVSLPTTTITLPTLPTCISCVIACGEGLQREPGSNFRRGKGGKCQQGEGKDLLLHVGKDLLLDFDFGSLWLSLVLAHPQSNWLKIESLSSFDWTLQRKGLFALSPAHSDSHLVEPSILGCTLALDFPQEGLSWD